MFETNDRVATGSSSIIRQSTVLIPCSLIGYVIYCYLAIRFIHLIGNEWGRSMPIAILLVIQCTALPGMLVARFLSWMGVDWITRELVFLDLRGDWLQFVARKGLFGYVDVTLGYVGALVGFLLIYLAWVKIARRRWAWPVALVGILYIIMGYAVGIAPR